MPQKTLLETAAGILAGRAHTEAELRKKLVKRAGSTPEEVEPVLASLKRAGFLSDRNYTDDFVRVMRGRGYGDQRIRAKLLQKGVDRELVSEILSADAGDHDPFTEAMAFLKRRARRINSAEDPVRRTRRILYMLAGRGFPPDVAARAAAAWKPECGE